MHTRTAPVRVRFATLLMLSLATCGLVAAPPEAQEKPSPRMMQRQTPQAATVCVRKVPDLLRYDLQIVDDVLKKYGLSLGQVTPKPNGAPKGTILWQSMEPGSAAKCGTPIAVVVSNGPPRRDDVQVPPDTPRPGGCQVPDLRKHHISEVQAPLRKRQWSIRNAKERVSPENPGTILDQWPRPGTYEKCEGWIDVVVAVPPKDPPPPPTPPPCEIADFRGLHINDALARAKAAGLHVESVLSEPSLERADMVIKQSLRPGRALRCDSPLVLVTATPPPIVYCDVPDVLGTEITVAQQRFADRGFKVAGVKADYSGRPRDTVIMQSPKAWTPAQCGSGVYLQVSAGPQPCEVPNLEAIDLAGARRVLKDRNFQLGKVSTLHSERIAETVLEQYPTANTTAECGSKIDVTIAMPPPVYVPALQGKDEERARRTLEGMRLTLGRVERRFSETATAGLVFEQEPAVNTPVQRGSAVRIWISEGPEVGRIPDVRRLDRAAAAAVLSKDRFRLGGVFDRQVETTPGTIVEQQPRAGSVERVGTAVQVWIAVPMPAPPPPSAPPKPQPPTPVTLTPVTPTPVTPTPVPPTPVTPVTPPPVTPTPVTPTPVTPTPTRPAPAALTPIRSAPAAPPAIPAVGESVAPQPLAQLPGVRVENPTAPVPTTLIPDVVGSSASQASTVLRAAGFLVGSLSTTPSTAAAGTVTWQQPPAGRPAAPGTQVALEIATALPAQAIMPIWWVVLGVLAAAAVAAARILRRTPGALPASVTLEPRPDTNVALTLSGDGPLIRSELWLKACPDAGVQTAQGPGPFGMMEVAELR